MILLLLPACGLSQPVHEGSRGYLTTPAELRRIAARAAEGAEPYRTNVADFMYFIGEPEFWPYGSLDGLITLDGGSSSEPAHLSAAGAKLVYGKAIAYHLTGDERYAAAARERILDLTNTHGYYGEQGSRQLTLNLSRGGTPYIYAADLLEDYWSLEDKRSYQRWLRDVMYPRVAWSSRVRKNNWGVAGSFSAAAIADYLADTGWLLEETEPEARTLTPPQAYREHNALQIGRQSTTEEWKMDAKTPALHGKDLWGILPNGGIPEEIRRGDNPIDADYFSSLDGGSNYSQTYIEHLTAHAEFLLRRGDSSLFDNVWDDGSGSLLQAYRFLIDNPHRSWPFTEDRRAALYIADRYYGHPSLRISLSDHGPSSIEGQRLTLFARLTHDRPDDDSNRPPFTPPPGE